MNATLRLPVCLLCQKQYSAAAKPVYLCKGMHCVCSQCIQDALTGQKPAINCPTCPDRVDLTTKTMNDFGVNLAFWHAIEEQLQNSGAKCSNHPKEDLDMYCLKCRAVTCHLCKNMEHKYHKDQVYLRGKIQPKAQEICNQLAKKTKEITEIERLRLNALNEATDHFENKVDEYISDLTARILEKGEELKRTINGIFENERNRIYVADLLEQQIIQWKVETEVLLRNFNNNNNHTESEKEKLLGDLFQRKLVLENLDDAKWANQKQQEASILFENIQNISIEYNNMLAQAIQNLPLGEVNLNSERKIDNKEEKVICGPYVIKLTDPLNLKRVKRLFSGLEDQGVIIEKADDIGVFAVKNCLLNDNLAKQLNDLKRNTHNFDIIVENSIQQIIFSFGDLTDEGLEHINSFVSVFSNLKKLTIDFQQRPNISLSKFKFLLMSLSCQQELQELKIRLQDWSELSNQEYITIIKTISAFAMLEFLAIDITRCKSVSNKGMKKGVKHLSKLEQLRNLYLIFQGCKKINDDELVEVGQKLAKFESLETLMLDFRGCPKFTHQDNQIYFGLKPRLSALDVTIYND